jgi:RimJ/RimL family protein N-acetyltransferase
MGLGINLDDSAMTVRLAQLPEFSPVYLSWLNDPEINQYTSRGAYPVTETEARQYVATCQSSQRIVWAVFAPAHVGNISLQQIDLINRTAELAILIGDKTAQGKGYGLEAAKLACAHGFKQLGLNRIYCGTHQGNIGMQKLAERLGMRKEGQSRQALFKNGKFADILHYGLLKEEFLNADRSLINWR